MAYSLLLRTKAETDVDNSVEYYNKESSDLGIEFYLEYLSFIDLIENFPERFPPTIPPYRRALMKKFPFGIYFHVNESKKEILIFAVWHIRRNQKDLYKRLNL